MQNTAIETSRVSVNRIGLLKLCSDAFHWIATWAERNVDTGADGQHIPKNVRAILGNRNFYI
ncbi:MAG: hypothetical protein HKN63_12180 [Rhodobacteraceae bacterium]|nr:hypothetical protein [Paracoccaceae bacterium]